MQEFLQLKSAVILAGLNSYGITKINEVKKSRNHTENMLLKNNHAINIKKGKKFYHCLWKKNLNSININVPNDPSSAAFLQH